MTDKSGGVEVRDFSAFLLDRPKTHAEVSEALHDLVGKVIDTGKPGTLSLVIKVGPFEKDVDRLIVAEEIKLKLPEHDRPVGIFFPDKNGNLTRNDPNAFDMFNDSSGTTRVVDLPTGEVKDLP